MKNVISVASAKPEYDTGFVVLKLAEMVARKNPGKRILTIHKHYNTDQKEAIYEYIYPFSDVPVFQDIHDPGIYSLYVDAYFKMSKMHPDLAIHIVKSFAKKYDLVICDAGNQIEDALALGCLFESEKSYYVFDHTTASIERFVWLKKVLDGLGIKVGGQILDHSKGRPEYGYGEFVHSLENIRVDMYIVDEERGLDEISMLADTISCERFDRVREDEYEDRGDR